MKTVACKGCGKAIVWGTLPNGRLMPLDPAPPCYTKAGELTDGTISVMRAEYTWVSHFATCKNPSRFSGQSRKRESDAGD